MSFTLLQISSIEALLTHSITTRFSAAASQLQKPPAVNADVSVAPCRHKAGTSSGVHARVEGMDSEGARGASTRLALD